MCIWIGINPINSLITLCLWRCQRIRTFVIYPTKDHRKKGKSWRARRPVELQKKQADSKCMTSHEERMESRPPRAYPEMRQRGIHRTTGVQLPDDPDVSFYTGTCPISHFCLCGVTQPTLSFRFWHTSHHGHISIFFGGIDWFDYWVLGLDYQNLW